MLSSGDWQSILSVIKTLALAATPFLLKALLDRTPNPQVEEERIISQRLDNIKKAVAMLDAMRGLADLDVEKKKIRAEFSRIVAEQADQEKESLDNLERYFSRRLHVGLSAIWFTRPRREALIARRFRAWGLILGMVGLILPSLPAIVFWNASPQAYQSFAFRLTIFGILLFISGVVYLQISKAAAAAAMGKLRLAASAHKGLTDAAVPPPPPPPPPSSPEKAANRPAPL